MKKYFTPPPFKVFKELKISAILVLQQDKSHMSKRRVETLQYLQNIGDSFMTILQPFDTDQLLTLSEMLSDETKREIRTRYVSADLIMLGGIFK